MIVMCFNNKKPYVDQARVAIKSIKINSPDTPITAHLVNFDQDAFMFINKVHVKLSNIKSITAYSLLAMYKTLKQTKTSILWLDTDVIVRKNLLPFLENTTPNTLKVLKRDAHKEATSFNTGVVAVGYSNITLNLLKEAAHNALLNPSWYADQIYLYRAYEKYKKNLNFINLLYDKKWHDVGGTENSFSQSSAIWHCKSSHFNESPFIDEYNYYNRGE